MCCKSKNKNLANRGGRKGNKKDGSQFCAPPTHPAPSVLLCGDDPGLPTPVSGPPVFALACRLENELTKDKRHALKYLEELFTYELMASIILGEGILTLHAYFIRQASEDTGDLPEVGRLASDRQS